MVYDRLNLQYNLWNPVINSERTECSFDVLPHQRGVASVTTEVMSEFLKCLTSMNYVAIAEFNPWD